MSLIVTPIVIKQSPTTFNAGILALPADEGAELLTTPLLLEFNLLVKNLF